MGLQEDEARKHDNPTVRQNLQDLHEELQEILRNPRVCSLLAQAETQKVVSVFSKCERVKRNLKEVFSYVNVRYDDDEPDRATTCVIDVDDRELGESLAEFGKTAGMWATASSLTLNKRKVDSSDIVINQALCGETTKESYASGRWKMPHIDSIAKLPSHCKVTSVHIHNKNDNNPATHLHIECDGNDTETLDALTTLMADANRVSWEMCGQPKFGKKKVRAEMF